MNSTELQTLKAKQKATWESGDFGEVAKVIMPCAEEFMARLPITPETPVLDVACGSGNLAIVAARQGCATCGVDIAANLIAQARERAASASLDIDFIEGDAEALPYPGQSFAAVVSMFGIMFAPRPEVVASELYHVTRSGGFVALANWTPEGFIGKMFEVFKAHLPPPAGIPSPMLWGSEAAVRERLNGFCEVRMTRRIAVMQFPFSPEDTVAFFRRYYGPTGKALPH